MRRWRWPLNKIRRLSCALPRNRLRNGRQDLSQNASRRLRIEGLLNAQLKLDGERNGRHCAPDAGSSGQRKVHSAIGKSRRGTLAIAKFPQNRELTGKYRQEPPSEAIGAIDRSRAQFNEAYLEDLVVWGNFSLTRVPVTGAQEAVWTPKTEREVGQLIEAMKGNRWGHRDATMVLIAFRHWPTCFGTGRPSLGSDRPRTRDPAPQ